MFADLTSESRHRKVIKRDVFLLEVVQENMICWKPILKIIYCIRGDRRWGSVLMLEASFGFETPFRCELIPGDMIYSSCHQIIHLSIRCAATSITLVRAHDYLCETD